MKKPLSFKSGFPRESDNLIEGMYVDYPFFRLVVQAAFGGKGV